MIIHSLQTYPAARIAGKGFKWTTDEPVNKDTRIGQFSDYAKLIIIHSTFLHKDIIMLKCLSIFLIQNLVTRQLGCVPTQVERLLMVECISASRTRSSLFLLVVTIKSQAMSSSNLTKLTQPMLQNTSAMSLSLRRTATIHMRQTQLFFDLILRLFQPLQAMGAQVLILEMLSRCACMVLSRLIFQRSPIHAALMDAVSLHTYLLTWSLKPLVTPLYQ